MSMPMTMDEPEGFLSRWSRLKREAREESPPPLPVAEPDETSVPVEEDAPADSAEPVFDPASLPPVESLGADSDYTAFLAPEVPQAIRIQALRKAWVSDPVIANFRGFAEYDWDCNAPGYGALLPTDRILDMVDSVLGKEEAEEEEAPAEEETPVAASAPKGVSSDVPPTPSASRAAQQSPPPSVD